MTVRILCCDEEILNEENKGIIFKHLNESSFESSTHAIMIPYDAEDQAISSTLEEFATECEAQQLTKGKMKRIYLSSANNTLDYLHKGMYNIARTHPDEFIEMDVYLNLPLSAIQDYFKDRSFPGNIKLTIHSIENNKISGNTLAIQGQGFINEDKYFIHNSPALTQLNLIRGLLGASHDQFSRKALLKLGSVLLEKANQQNKEELSAFGAAIHGILLRYKLMQEQVPQQPLIKDAIEHVVMQALSLATSLSSKTKTAAFFSEHKYFSLDDLKVATSLMQNVLFVLDQPSQQNIKIMMNDLKRLNNTNNAQYLVAAGIILAGALIMTGPLVGLIGLGITGVFATTSMLLALLAVTVATVVTPIMGALTMVAGTNAILIQKNDAEVKTKLDDAITKLQTIASPEGNSEYVENRNQESLTTSTVSS